MKKAKIDIMLAAYRIEQEKLLTSEIALLKESGMWLECSDLTGEDKNTIFVCS